MVQLNELQLPTTRGLRLTDSYKCGTCFFFFIMMMMMVVVMVVVIMMMMMMMNIKQIRLSKENLVHKV